MWIHTNNNPRKQNVNAHQRGKRIFGFAAKRRNKVKGQAGYALTPNLATLVLSLQVMRKGHDPVPLPR